MLQHLRLKVLDASLPLTTLILRLGYTNRRLHHITLRGAAGVGLPISLRLCRTPVARILIHSASFAGRGVTILGFSTLANVPSCTTRAGGFE